MAGLGSTRLGMQQGVQQARLREGDGAGAPFAATPFPGIMPSARPLAVPVQPLPYPTPQFVSMLEFYTGQDVQVNVSRLQALVTRQASSLGADTPCRAGLRLLRHVPASTRPPVSSGASPAMPAKSAVLALIPVLVSPKPAGAAVPSGRLLLSSL